MTIPFHQIILEDDFDYSLNNTNKNDCILQSLKIYGLLHPILLNYDEEKDVYQLIDGGFRLHLLKELGREELQKGEMRIFRNLSEENRLCIRLTVNESRRPYNIVKMSLIIDRLLAGASVDDIKLKIPFTEEEILRLSELTKFDWTQYKNHRDHDISPTAKNMLKSKALF